jgi:hypothetical protein
MNILEDSATHLHLQGRKWRQQIPPEDWYPYTRLCGITSQKNNIKIHRNEIPKPHIQMLSHIESTPTTNVFPL